MGGNIEGGCCSFILFLFGVAFFLFVVLPIIGMFFLALLGA